MDMPTYDFICLDCKKRFDLFMTYSEYGTKPVACPHCSSSNVRRRMTRVRIAKSEDSRLDSLGDFSDPSALEGLENLFKISLVESYAVVMNEDSVSPISFATSLIE